MRMMPGDNLRPGAAEVEAGAMRILVVLALSVPLAGCFSLTAPKPLPEWAMNPRADVVAEPAAKRQRASRVMRPAVEETASVASTPTNVQPAGLGRAVARRKPTALTTDVTAFSTEWHAREDARDAELRRSMGNICRGC
jgi:hypothetical protein